MKRLAALSLTGVMLLAACKTLPYREDLGYLVSAHANSPEYPVFINGGVCADMDGGVGLCAKRIKSTDNIRFKFPAQPYAYLASIQCTSGVRPIEPATGVPNVPLEITLEASAFAEFRSFTCIGEISPQDRPGPLSAKFRVSFSVQDAQYAGRERIQVIQDGGKNYLVLGQFARTAWVFDGAWRRYDRATIVELKGAPSAVRAFSESYAMRYNYLGFTPGGAW